HRAFGPAHHHDDHGAATDDGIDRPHRRFIQAAVHLAHALPKHVHRAVERTFGAQLLQAFAHHAAGDIAVAIAAHAVGHRPHTDFVELDERVLVGGTQPAYVGDAGRDIHGLDIFFDHRFIHELLPQWPAGFSQPLQLLFIGARERFAEQIPEAGFGVLDHLAVLVAIQIPVSQLARHADDGALHLPI